MTRPAVNRRLNFDEEPETERTSPTQSNVVLYHLMMHYKAEAEAYAERFNQLQQDFDAACAHNLRMQQSHIQLYDRGLELQAALTTAITATDDYWSIIVSMRNHGVDTTPWANAIDRAAIRAEIAHTMGTRQQPIDLTGEETEPEEV